jgi:RNA recognition motif-containing protein
LFVRNIPSDAIDEDLKRVFEKYGPVEKVLIMI